MLKRLKLRAWFAPFILIVAFGAMGAVRENGVGNDIRWQESATIAGAISKTEQKPMLLSFSTPGCGWCAKLNSETLSDPTVTKCSRSFVCLHIDSSTDPDTTNRYSVTSFPTIILVNRKGESVARIEEFTTPDHLAAAMQTLLDSNK